MLPKYLTGSFDLQVFFGEDYFSLIKVGDTFVLYDSEERYHEDSFRNICDIFKYGYFDEPITCIDRFVKDGNVILERVNIYDREKYIQQKFLNKWKKVLN